MKPIPADTEKGISRNHKAQIPPMAERGIATKTMSASITELNVK